MAKQLLAQIQEEAQDDISIINIIERRTSKLLHQSIPSSTVDKMISSNYMLKLLFGSIIFSLLLITIIGGALGFVPGVSGLMGASPRDLGQKATLAESRATQEKVGTEIVILPAGTPNSQGYIPEGNIPLSTSFTSQELTALANNRTWKNFPVKNVQIRINPDNTIESSGILIVSKAIPFAEGLGYSAAQVKQAMEKYKLPSVEIPYYISGQGEVKNNQVSLSVSSLKIGAIPVPSSITQPATEEAISFLEGLFQRYQANFYAETIKAQNNQVQFVGQVAKQISVVSQ
jgi:hypothetical protein